MSEEVKDKPEAAPAETPRDWVGETVKCFITDAEGIDPTDPISAIAGYFAKNATDELKAKCEAEGKNATLCWKFIEEVAREALGGRSGHIDPGVVYAIAMHYFQDVPKDWKAKPAPNPPTPSEVKKEKAKKAAAEKKAKKAAEKKAKKSKPKTEQGFFFDLLATPEEGAGDGNA